MQEYIEMSPRAKMTTGLPEIRLDKLGHVGGAILEVWMVKHCSVNIEPEKIRNCAECFGQSEVK
jgi:hypothetical protein